MLQFTDPYASISGHVHRIGRIKDSVCSFTGDAAAANRLRGLKMAEEAEESQAEESCKTLL